MFLRSICKFIHWKKPSSRFGAYSGLSYSYAVWLIVWSLFLSVSVFILVFLLFETVFIFIYLFVRRDSGENVLGSYTLFSEKPSVPEI